ncbi:hypothetical protein C4K23_2193 [Pseudomonas chlororaphis]|nr:hypothetical protein C4K23_2193 [Pseudomonas chlororaphis]
MFEDARQAIRHGPPPWGGRSCTREQYLPQALAFKARANGSGVY